MYDKMLGLAALGLSGASQAFIRHDDTAMFFSIVFFAIGAYEFLLGEFKERKAK
jgi:hypothetical protein